MPTTLPEAASIIGPPDDPGVGSGEARMNRSAEAVPGCLVSLSDYSFGLTSTSCHWLFLYPSISPETHLRHPRPRAGQPIGSRCDAASWASARACLAATIGEMAGSGGSGLPKKCMRRGWPRYIGNGLNGSDRSTGEAAGMSQRRTSDRGIEAGIPRMGRTRGVESSEPEAERMNDMVGLPGCLCSIWSQP